MVLPLLLVFYAILLQHVDAWPHWREGRHLLDKSSVDGTGFDIIAARSPHRTGPSIPEPQHAPYEGSWKERAGYWRRRLSREIDIGVYSELEEYLQAQDEQPNVDCTTAVRNQSLPTSAQLGLAPWDSMRELESIPARVSFLNQLTRQVCSNANSSSGGGSSSSRSGGGSGQHLGGGGGGVSQPRIAAFTVWNGNMWGLRRSLLPWMQWVTQQGVCRVYLAYQGRDEATYRWLKQISSLSLILISPPFAPAEEVRAWWAFANTSEWAVQPGNYRLMAKQGYCGDIAIQRGMAEGMQWLMHIDVDELPLPAVSLAADLASVPSWAGGVRMLNHEALVESFEVTNKYEEVTLFKTHDSTLPAKAGDLQYRFRLGTYGAFFQVYHNGKSIVRLDRAHVHTWGPHGFLGPQNDTWIHPEHNPEGEFMTVDGRTVLLHVSYTSWHDLIGKARSSCPAKYRDYARKGNRTKVNECFCLDFDLDAYMAAVRGEKAAREYWITTSLFSEGAVRKEAEGEDGKPLCKVYTDVERLKGLLIRDRFLIREMGPQQVLRAHEVAIRGIAGAMGLRWPGGGGGGKAAGGAGGAAGVGAGKGRGKGGAGGGGGTAAGQRREGRQV